MKYTKEEAEKKYPGVIFLGNVSIREGASIGERASVGEGACVGAGACVGERASITSVCGKCTGNIVPMKDKVLIRIGCEIHPIEQWRSHGEELAEKYNEKVWWRE